MSDLNINGAKSSALLYLRDDRVKLSLNSFFTVSKIFEKSILLKIDNSKLGIADIRCLLLIHTLGLVNFLTIVSLCSKAN